VLANNPLGNILKAEDNDNPAIDNPVNFKNFLLSNVTPLSSCQGPAAITQAEALAKRTTTTPWQDRPAAT